ncbi:MAG: hypothetical protein GX072_11525 [Lysinibacillus sp.]|nr:hypothetical protein [Lysinibacillus sp.]
MSLPSVPDITPDITLNRCDAINLLLSSIAMEEIGLSHILNAEGEKLQTFLKMYPRNLHGYIKLNDSVNTTLRTVVKSQILLQFKLEDVITLNKTSGCDPCHPPKHSKHQLPCKKCKHHECKHDDPCVDFHDDSLCYCPNKDCQCPKCKEKKKHNH